jgi:hypothetical protein
MSDLAESEIIGPTVGRPRFDPKRILPFAPAWLRATRKSCEVLFTFGGKTEVGSTCRSLGNCCAGSALFRTAQIKRQLFCPISCGFYSRASAVAVHAKYCRVPPLRGAV